MEDATSQEESSTGKNMEYVNWQKESLTVNNTEDAKWR